jgi:hypothetical protein
VQKDNARNIIAKLVLALSLSLIMISCKKSEMLIDPPSTNGISIKLYRNYAYADNFIEKYNINMVSSIKLSELPSLSITTYYKYFSFHPISISNKINNATVFFIVKDNVTNEINVGNVFQDVYEYYYSYYNYYNNDSSFFNATVYAFLVKDMAPIITDTINFEIIHDGVKEIIPIISNKNTVDIIPSLIINKNLIDAGDAQYISYKLLCNDNERVGIIWNRSIYNNQFFWGIDFCYSGETYNYAFENSTSLEQLKFYAFKLIY